jgi:protein-S-isoprenylcysteine O-methyltransferase Ste14
VNDPGKRCPGGQAAAVVVVVDGGVIAREERYLRASFGEDYLRS